MDCKLAKKSTNIRVQVTDQAVPTFSKDTQGPNRLLLTWPSVPETQNRPVRPPLSNINNRNSNNGNYNQGGVQSRATNGHNNNNANGNSIGKPIAPPPPIPQRVQSNY